MSYITVGENVALDRPESCPILTNRIKSVSNYLEAVSSAIDNEETYWFRGQHVSSWPLTPSGLRGNPSERDQALGLIYDFKRIAELKVIRPPELDDHLKWMQLAQHYGIPTRLLDWTENAIFALYFACQPESNGYKYGGVSESSGMVYLMNPKSILGVKDLEGYSPRDHSVDKNLAAKYDKAGGKLQSRMALPTIAVKPVWNSERLALQRGVFTLHGSRKFSLDNTQIPSLVGIPILSTYKESIRTELDSIGVDEMTMFPELEYACKYLKRRALMKG